MAYRLFLILLVLALTGQGAELFVHGCAYAAGVQIPHPDRWHWKPEPGSAEGVGFHFRAMPGDDVLISALIPVERGEDHYLHREHVAFFSGRKYSSAEEVFAGKLPRHQERHSINVQADRLLTAISSDECARGLLAGLRLRNSAGERLASTSLVFVLDQPKSYPTVICEEEEYPGFSSSIVVLRPQSLYELRDGSILVATNEGLVLRVKLNEDGMICTRSGFLGDRLFLADTDWLMGEVRSVLETNPKQAVDWPKLLEGILRELKQRGSEAERC